MATMRQASLATAGFERYSQPTRRGMFLPETGRVVPWQVRCAPVDSEYLKPGRCPVHRSVLGVSSFKYLAQHGADGATRAPPDTVDAERHRQSKPSNRYLTQSWDRQK